MITARVVGPLGRCGCPSRGRQIGLDRGRHPSADRSGPSDPPARSIRGWQAVRNSSRGGGGFWGLLGDRAPGAPLRRGAGVKDVERTSRWIPDSFTTWV